MNKKKDLLKLDNQICFPLYAASHLIIKMYKPLLDQIGLTYPQYLVMLVLWEEDNVPVKHITEKLFLETNTLTPLLKRLEKVGLIQRIRSDEDERKVNLLLTQEGKDLKKKALTIPKQLIQKIKCNCLNEEELHQFKETLDRMIDYLNESIAK